MSGVHLRILFDHDAEMDAEVCIFGDGDIVFADSGDVVFDSSTPIDAVAQKINEALASAKN
jgi:hypothetical protein